MKVTFFGTRGSYPVCRREVVRYGGNTTCLLVEHDGDSIVVDGGSGIARLGKQLVADGVREMSLVLTHPHWDHVMGLPFFKPLYTEGFKLDVYGADSENKTLGGLLAMQHHVGHFPVSFDALPAQVATHQLKPNDSVNVGGVRVRSFQLNHPGVDLGYRFEAGGKAFVVLTDLAPVEDNLLGAGWAQQADGAVKEFERSYYEGLVEFVRGADVVYHDTNFTDDEIQGKVHWGHSTPTHALELMAQHDAPPALLLSHHDPSHDDDFMDGLVEATQKQGKALGVEVLVAREGEDLTC